MPLPHSLPPSCSANTCAPASPRPTPPANPPNPPNPKLLFHQDYIPRKPRDTGKEIKDLADVASKMILAIEAQRGKVLHVASKRQGETPAVIESDGSTASSEVRPFALDGVFEEETIAAANPPAPDSDSPVPEANVAELKKLLESVSKETAD